MSATSAIIVALVIGLVFGFTAFEAVRAIRGDDTAAAPQATAPLPQQTNPTVPPSSVPSAPTGPIASALAGLVVRQADVASGVTVQPLPGADQVAGQPTLDICNGTFASEALRTARLQVAAVDDQGSATLSTEAVAYKSERATEQAFAELKATAASCPSRPVESPVGEPTVTTRFNSPPDGTWPQTATVSRIAFDMTTTDSSGQSDRSIAVYLRRGRVLMGVYFPNADADPSPVRSETTRADIVHLFAERMQALPPAIVNG